jgi:hypothetical protein
MPLFAGPYSRATGIQGHSSVPLVWMVWIDVYCEGGWLINLFTHQVLINLGCEETSCVTIVILEIMVSRDFYRLLFTSGVFPWAIG